MKISSRPNHRKLRRTPAAPDIRQAKWRARAFRHLYKEFATMTRDGDLVIGKAAESEA